MSPVAMHMSDGLLNAPTSIAFLAVAAVGVGFALVKARADLDDRTAPMAGLVATFIFAVQMINFPILPGASGHLLGGALAAILVGPYVGALCVTIVLVVQALLFADGGLTAIGANVTNMALIGTATGFLVAVALRKLAERGKGGLATVAFISAFVNTVVAATGFIVEYAIGGAGGVEIGKVALLMWGLHALIGIGEGLITAVTVTSVASIRPDLVYLLKGNRKPLEVRS
ncbi:energy-coupling factor ABC transporter permease [Lentzea sp. PSKA42]|uniref:Energy-coupling factor ABC transporter permease n=1 Tax=Lentzea indica TaxID=2604800 RepID=A0ABX1FS91_9PSEU|nr:energy-coupling factor ABC transporter permease [Lentzea indica]NKE61898.1 energy-coupling factor ABC transporter permease [Lentzea indica]